MTPFFRLVVLMVLAVPVFSGWSPLPDGGEILSGVSRVAVWQVVVVIGTIAGCCGRAFLANILAVTALILIPIVFLGGLVAYVTELWKGAAPGAAGFIHGAHYVMLTLNMLSVIPLALAIVASIPFDRLVQKLLRRATGISAGEKYLLMFMRVFSHIVYSVIPNILEILREEAMLRPALKPRAPETGWRGITARGRHLMAGMVQIGVSGICASLRFIPLWAREIDDLPRRTSKKHRRPS